MRKPILFSIIGICLLVQVPIAEAHGGHGAGAAVAAGLLGIGLGMAIAAPRPIYYGDPVYEAPTVIEHSYYVPEYHHYRRYDYDDGYRGYYRPEYDRPHYYHHGGGDW